LGEDNFSELIDELNFEADQPPAGFNVPDANGTFTSKANGWTISGTGGTWQLTGAHFRMESLKGHGWVLSTMKLMQAKIYFSS